MLAVQLFNGLVYGALLIVMCSGLALIYGLRRVVNFAHGALYMLGAYIGFSVASVSNFWVALVMAPLVMAVIGVLIDRYGFRLLQDREPLNVMLVTFGLLLILEDLVVFIWGKTNYSLFTPWPLDFSVSLFAHAVPAYRIAVLVVGLLVAGFMAAGLDTTGAGVVGAADTLRAHLGFAQSLAMANNVADWSVVFNSGSYALLRDSGPSPIPWPGETNVPPHVHRLPLGVSCSQPSSAGAYRHRSLWYPKLSLWPPKTSRKRFLAQRPLPSMMIATWTGVREYSGISRVELENNDIDRRLIEAVKWPSIRLLFAQTACRPQPHTCRSASAHRPALFFLRLPSTLCS